MGWGALLLARGDGLWRALTGRAPSASERGVVTVLAVRHLGQGLLQTLAPTRLPRLWRATDLAHAASMVALAAADPARRRPALLSGAVSLAAVAVATRELAAGRPPVTASAPLATPRRARRPRG
ncbi:hypothetical protein SAMN04488543_3707 [Friedmanniella luteola]|uniref:Uncharacterized protein n=1 Tax=Friedmanniella luteola TaxID=546871 RepID=A0A1H1ZF34_9ACTN|nr:hypothetical protein [Friedmanniella luteola]SDT31816.1 hypothetical protein SAMN04488543_3707 [Friedmanniella luteola]